MPESIVHQTPAVQSNPFARHAPEHVNAGTIAIESERAIAEAQGKLIIAKRFPRSQSVAYANIIDACKRQGLAEEAVYSFPRGGQTVSGPSIRLAEMLAANWGNIDYGIRELSRKEGVSEMEAYAWDLETNTVSSQKFTVRHIRDTKGGGVALRDERDIYELTANMGGRRLRARILAILPADLIQAAVDECGKTLAGGNDLPISDRIRNAVTAFKAFGVQPAHIEKRLGHALDVTTGEELADLRKIHNSIRDGVSKVGDWFGDGAKSEDGETLDGDPVPPRPEPPKRSKKGAAAVTENAEPQGQTVTPAPVPEPTKEPVKTAEPVKEAPKAVDPIQQYAAAVKEAVVEKAVTETLAGTPAPRAFLQDGEKLEVEITVQDIGALNITTSEGTKPSVKAKVAGGFVGEIYHIDGGVTVDGKAAIAPPWSKGAVLKAVLLGKLNNKVKNDAGGFGKVQVFVQSVEPAVAEEGMEA